MDSLNNIHMLIGRTGEDIAWWQMTARAALIFLYGIVLVRFAGKRVFGKWGAIDIVLSVIIGSNLSRALTGNAPFAETLVATTALVGLHAALTAAAVRAPALGPLIKGKPACLASDGRIDDSALARHGVGRHDFDEAVRAAGLSRADDVAEAWIERNGDISIIRR